MRSFTLIGLVVGLLVAARPVQAQSREEETVVAATSVLREVMSVPLKGIPASLLADAQGVAVAPGLIRGGFIVGVEHGRGVVVVRDKNGAWQSPNFFTLTGAGIGWQAGVQSTDLVLVFRTRQSVDGLMRGRFKVGADASVAAGPIGRQMSAGTDAQLKSEIFSYSRARGLFVGLSLDGAVLQIDQRANAAFYARASEQYPQSALNFITLLASFTNTPAGSAAPANPGGAAPPVTSVPTTERDAIARQLLESSQRLNRVLDDAWRQFLALPPSLADGAAVATTRSRFQSVAGNPMFRSLAERHEFQETLALLNRYVNASTPGAANVLQLPPPPK